MTGKLVFLWEFSLLLSAVALLAISALLLARVARDRLERRREDIRLRLLPSMLRGQPAEVERSRLFRRVAADLTVELAELVRGNDREGFIAAATQAGAGKELARRLRSRASQDRLIAAEALAMFPQYEGTVSKVALGDKNADVRLGAALALAHEGRAPPVGELVRRLGIGSTERSLLVVSLMRDLARSDPHAVAALLYDFEIPDAAKLAATDALADSAAVDHAPLIAWMAEASEEEGDLRPRILRALGKVGHPSAHEAILAGLDSESWPVRTTAAEAAGRAALVTAVPRLSELLDDGQWWVRFRAGEALMRLGSAGRAALRKAASDGRPAARAAATTIMAEQGAT
ncbi:HEAT repeat domain-containing protein [Tsuneonella sp. YG55]|uniref:HEAT repeat domain-containing protein n=1 Tax=Tsuneonella litorea TaxID=2976475 RepID=A0A9X2W202_9SPHN|nr:HEAT repeat domain-containing protein [Tsuneonella litorea]MCT2558431.1 HEAT repeat domain-containing protein [Tsuneonella litorea]